MDKEGHEENNQTVSGDFIVKRKRGRPRKHRNLESNEQSLGTVPGFSRTQQENHDEAMIGQPITGVVEATFEAGFLLAVKIGNSDTMLRGVVFKPGHCDPVSVDNDIAPDVPTIRRNSDVMRHDGSAKRGRKSRFREKRVNRTLVPVPIQPAHPTIPENAFVQLPIHLQNGGGQASIHHSPMQTEMGSQASGASNGKPFETLLTQVMNKGQVHHTAQSIEPESDEQALAIEPLQAIHPVHPAHMLKPMPSYGQGNMTELLQAVQENVRETHFGQGH